MRLRHHPSRLVLSPTLAAAALLACGIAQAAKMTDEAHASAKSEIESRYEADRNACKAMKDNAKDVCVEEAKGNRDVALARLQYQYSGSQRDEKALYEAQYKARYAVAKEKCDNLGGNDHDVCLSQAKSERDKAAAEVKLAKTTADAIGDASSEHAEADYKVAREKCDSLAGDAKDSCIAQAKSRYGQN